MRKLLIATTALLAMTACAQVQNETGEVRELPDGFYAGTKYIVRTQTVAGRNGPVERTSVVFRGISRTCIKDSPGDCEKAARALIEECADSAFCIV